MSRAVVERVITELIEALIRPAAAGRDTVGSVRVSMGHDTLRVEVSGNDASIAWAASQRWRDLRACVEGLGGAVGKTGSRGEGAAVDIPLDLRGMEVLLVRAGGARFGILGHRVLGTVEMPASAFAASGDEIRIVGKSIRLLDLARAFNADPCRGGAPSTSTVVLLRSGFEIFAIAADEVVNREQMVVGPANRSQAQHGVVGYCYSPRASEQGTRVPLLGLPVDERAPVAWGAEG